MNCVTCVRSGGKNYNPKVTDNVITRDEILEEYANWPDKFGKGYINVRVACCCLISILTRRLQLLCDFAGDPIRCYPQLDHPPAPTYIRGNVAIMGDAAHGEHLPIRTTKKKNKNKNKKVISDHLSDHTLARLRGRNGYRGCAYPINSPREYQEQGGDPSGPKGV